MDHNYKQSGKSLTDRKVVDYQMANEESSNSTEIETERYDYRMGVTDRTVNSQIARENFTDYDKDLYLLTAHTNVAPSYVEIKKS